MMQNYALVIDPGYADHRIEAGLLAEEGIGLRRLALDAPAGEKEALLAGASLLFVRDTRFDANLLALCRNAKGLVRYGVGVDGVDLAAARERGIKVANIPDYGADVEVADHTLALYLSVARRTVMRDAAVRRGVWGVGQAEPIRRIAGQTLGLIGYGRIARAVHRRFSAFGVEDVLVCDPFLDERQCADLHVRQVDLDKLAGRSDIVSLHLPGGDPENPVIDAAFLARMKPDAILINTSRGAHIDEAALASALSNGKLRGVGLDVLRQEPPDRDNPLLQAEGVVLSDHAGWYSEATVETLQKRAGEEAVRILRGQPPLNWVNP